MKRRVFALLLVAALLISVTGQAALVQGIGGSKSGVALSTPAPTAVPNVVKGLGLSGHTTQSTVFGSGDAQATAEPTMEPTAEPTTEPTAEPTTEPTAEPAAEPVVESTPMPVVEMVGGDVYKVKGFNEFEVTIKLNETGMIEFVFVSAQNETPGIGAAVLEDEALFEALRGLFIGDAVIDTVAGATRTTDALNDALRQAAEACGVTAAP